MQNLKSSLTAVIPRQLALAEAASTGRSAHVVVGGDEQALQQTVIALSTGQRLVQPTPTETTVYVLHGRVRLAAEDISCDGSAGDLLVMPGTGHSLRALEPSAILLTVVTSPAPVA